MPNPISRHIRTTIDSNMGFSNFTPVRFCKICATTKIQNVRAIRKYLLVSSSIVMIVC